MTMSMPTDDVAVAFRRTYQVIVDQTELPSGQLPAYGLTQRPRSPRHGWVFAGAAVAVALGFVGVALIRDDVPPAQSEVVDRIALVEVPSELGGQPTVVNSSVTSDGFDPVPPIDMWYWESGEEAWVVLLEAQADADLTTVLGPADDGNGLTAPTAGEVSSFSLPDTGWLGRSWLDGSDWRIAVGYDESAVTAIVEAATTGDPSEADVSGFDLVYEGPQFIYPPADVELSELFYTSPTGGFSVALFKGWEHATTAAALRSPNAELTEVNGMEAVITGNAVNWWIGWQIDDSSTALVESSDFGPDTLRAIAEGIQPVSSDDWESLAGSASPATTINSRPTAESFDTIRQPTVLASGDDWAIKSQAVTTPEDSAEPGKLGLCGWVEIEGQLSIDFGCSIEEPGQRLPVRVSTPDGPVVTGELRIEVAEVRFEGASLTVPVTQIHPDIPYGWFAIQLPPGTALTEYTFWSSEGIQLPIDPGTGDQLTGTVHSIN